MPLKPIRLIQITDTHLIAEPGAEVYGVDSFATLERLLEEMKGDGWTPDNAEELWALLGRHPSVRAILSGHNHCAVDGSSHSGRFQAFAWYHQSDVLVAFRQAGMI